MLDIPPAAKALLDTSWRLTDPLGRTFDDALASARNRAAGKLWDVPVLSRIVAYADLRALAVQSTFVLSNLTPDKRPNDLYSDRWGAAIARTGTMLADGVGYAGQPIGDIKKSTGQDPATTAEVPIIAIVAIVAASLVVAGAFAWLVYKSAEVVDRELARQPASDELVRDHNDAEKIISDHMAAEKAAGHEIPWSQTELDVLDRLEKAQYAILNGITPKPGEPGGNAVSAFGMGSLFGVAAVLGGLWYANRKGWI